MPPSRTVPTNEQPPAYKAPTFRPTVGETQVNISTVTPSVQESSVCTNDLTFIEDLTIPDGNTMAAGSSQEKQWKVKNSGTCAWTGDYTIQLISGDDLGTESSQSLASTAPGSELIISLYFTVPANAGRYTSTWRAFDAAGKPFGNWFSIEIISTGS